MDEARAGEWFLSRLKQKQTRWLGALCALACVLSAPTAELRVHQAFSDHAVLQRDRPIVVWGWAVPGANVNVTFGDRRSSAMVAADGTWRATLPPMPASARPEDISVASGEARVLIHDVVVGEVWLAAGQSNMHFRMAKIADAATEIPAEPIPAVRMLMVDESFSQQPQTDLAGRWQVATPETIPGFSAVAFCFARDLQRALGVPVGVVVSAVGGTRIETWMDRRDLADDATDRRMLAEWSSVPPDEFARIAERYRAYQRARDAASAAGNPAPKRPTRRCHDCPGALHDGMIAPLIPWVFRGAVWYQGEANSDAPGRYHRLMPALVARWRSWWGADLPLLFVQLPPYRGTSPEFRAAQAEIARTIPHSAMIVTTDVGEADDIHPARKQPVGARLALAAEGLAYGRPVVWQGPRFSSLRVDGDRVLVTFTHVDGGIKTRDGQRLCGFSLAGADGRFVESASEIVGDQVVVYGGKQVQRPLAVRYAWAAVPSANLINGAGLPAAPFSSE